jgi:hypothetical protein
MLLRAILAAVLGNVVMTLSSTTEMQWRGRQESTVPGQATAKLLGLIGIKPIEGRNLKILSNWTHWVYGASWGIVFWVYIDVLDLNLLVTAVLFFATVWGTAQINYGVLRLVPPFWTWGAKEVAIDVFHHVAYVTGTVIGWVLIERALP